MADHSPDEATDDVDRWNATNVERIRAALSTSPRESSAQPTDEDEVARSLQLGLAVQRNQMQRSLTHAGLGVGLAFPLLVADDAGKAGWIIGGLLVLHLAIQVVDFHRALAYYNLGVVRLNHALKGEKPQPEDDASTARLWFGAFTSRPKTIERPSGGSTGPLSTRLPSMGSPKANR